jgi:SAM-dependent methyltransferase
MSRTGAQAVPASSLAQASYDYQRRWSAVRRVLPRPLRRALRLCYFLTLDGMDLCLQRRRDLVPPRWRNPIGDGDFESTGAEFLGYFISMGGLEPSHHVLDVGCGIGRMARPLTQYLTSGAYEGFDIVPPGIQWCQKNVTPRYPNFRFTLADIRNQEYNAHGLVPASEYRFPYDDARFDFAFLTSVFTHMLAPEVSRYLGELARVLAPGGKCLATFFLVNPESRHLIDAGRSSLDLFHALPGCWTTNPQVPETAVGYEDQEVARLAGENGFRLESLSYGKWCGRTEYLSYQDVAVFAKI